MAKINRYIVIIFAALFLFFDRAVAQMDPPFPLNIDTNIRILLIADDRLSAGQVTGAKSYLTDAWNNTDFSGAPPTGLEFANNGQPIEAGALVFSGSDDDQIEKIRLMVEAPVIPTTTSLRDTHGADVVIGLSSDMDPGSCGTAPQDNWLGNGPFPFLGPNFVEDADGLDLREANGDYIAVARVTGPVSCRTYLVAHEFGHLLGGGHYDSIYRLTGGLLSNSKAFRAVLNPPIVSKPGTVWITALGAGPDTADCPSTDSTKCVHLRWFSEFGNSQSGTRNNAEAFNMTALSVANYRRSTELPVQVATCFDGFDNDADSFVDSADPDCSVCNEELCPVPPNPPPNCDATVAPQNLNGWILEVCVPGTSYTKYQIVWTHACPSSVTSYEIWAAQPTTNPFTFRWREVPPYTRAIVGGATAEVKIRSCGDGGCSALSAGSFFAVDQC